MPHAKETVGFVGLGVMGAAMAGHILSSGRRVLVYNRTKAKADALVAAGAEWRDSPALIAQECDLVCSIVGYPTDVEQVYLGSQGLIANAKKGAILIDMTTSSPVLAKRIYTEARAAGVRALDAPVSGGDIGAKNATLTIMVGGDEADFAAAKSLLETMGKTVLLQGPAGSGQHTKMANQIVIAGNLAGAVEAVTYARKAGLDPGVVLQSIASGSAGSWQLSNMVPRMQDGNFNPGFYAKHFLKDLRIALDSAREMGISLPLLSLAESLFDRVVRDGMGELGTQALYILYERGLA